MRASRYARFLLVAGLALHVLSGGAAVLDDPAAGARSGFFWDEPGRLAGIVDLGPDDGVSGEQGSDGWFMTLSSPSFIGLSMTVYNRPPTVFDLQIDGSIVAWSSAQIIPEVISEVDGVPIEIIHHFAAALDGYVLPAGEHFVTLLPSQFNSDGSTGLVSFAPAFAIPEPATNALLAAGLLLVLLARLRMRTSPRVRDRRRF